jgi:hypothetical protein
MKTLELVVFRKWFLPTYTIGNFLCDGKFLCNSLEDKVRNLQDTNHDGDFTDEGEGKIYGETAISCGRYEVIVSDSPKLKRRLPLFLDVVGFTGIRIHKLKTAKGTEGCIGVGENKIKGSLINGDYWEKYIIDLIDNAKKEGKRTFITIKE